MLPNRFRTQPGQGGELVDRRSRIINQDVEHPPGEARQFAPPIRLGDPMPARVAAEESPQRCDRALDVMRPDFHRQPAVHLPCDPRDVRSAERLQGLVSTPIPVERDEYVPSPEDRRYDRDPVPLHDPSFLEATDSVADRGRRQGYLAAECMEALPRVLVERDQEAEVFRVHGLPMAAEF